MIPNYKPMAPLAFLAFSLISLAACVSTKKLAPSLLVGNYAGTSPGVTKGATNTYTLTLRQDSTFTFQIAVHGASPTCQGRWKKAGNRLHLSCFEKESFDILLSNIYMNQREHTIKIIGRNRLNYWGTVLKRNME